MNPKFKKAAATLHPIPVKAQVWNQVYKTKELLMFRIKLKLFSYHNYQVGIDLIGPLPTTDRGNRYVVTLVDYFSKWPEAAPLPDKTAVGVASFLYELFCRYIHNKI